MSGRISISNLNDNLKELIMSSGLSETQINALIINMLGDLNNLETDDKSNIINAINEVRNKLELLKIQYEEIKNIMDDKFSIIECVALELNTNEIIFNELEQSQELIATRLPSNCNENVLWLTSNENIAVVKNGVVTSKGDGDCIITAVCGNTSVICNIKVKTTISLVLLENGVFTDNTLFGQSTFAKTNNTGFDLDKKCITIQPASNSNWVFGFGNHISAGTFTSSSKIKVTGYLTYVPGKNVSLTVGLCLSNRSDSISDWSSTVPSISKNIEIVESTEKYEYVIDASNFENYEGYLNICFGPGLSSFYITDIVVEL